MEGNFKYYNPTKLFFGKESLKNLKKELEQYGSTIMLSYGGGSIKTNGIYTQIIEILQSAGKTIIDDGGVMPNPTVEKMYDGAKKVREHSVDFILAVGGGSTIDYAKGVSASAYCEEDPWQKYYIRQENPSCKLVPIGAILTMVGTPSHVTMSTPRPWTAGHSMDLSCAPIPMITLPARSRSTN